MWRAWVGSTEWSSAFCWASLQAQLPHSSPFVRKGGIDDLSSSLPSEDGADGVELRHHSAAPAAGAARWRLAASTEQMARQDIQQAGQMPQAIDYGDPGPIRTGDLPLRRGTLYPAELRGHWQRRRIPRLAEWTKPSKRCGQANTPKLTFPAPARPIDADCLVVPFRPR